MKLFFTTAVLVSLAVAARAQSLPVPQRTLITQAVDESRTVILQGNTHSLARAEFDQGPAPAELPMNRIQMLLRRSPEAESALAQFVEDQQNSASPEFHHWLSPEEFGERFGPSLTDIGEILAWLESHGFRVELVSAGRSVIEFSGNARAVREAFRTEIHAYDIHGSHHWANSSDPQVPAALAPVIAGIVSLHNFESKPQVRSMGWTGAIARPGLQPETNLGGAVHALSPGDYAVIYNATLLLNAGTNGSGRSIAVIGRSNINTQDIADFRRVFGLAANPFQVTVNGTDPGDLGGDEELEAVLDNSWAGALAPNASINFVVSASTNSSDGVFLSEQYAIDNNIADVISESFGSCEANYTQSAANYLSSLAEQAAAQGMTYVVATGDSGSAGCDNPSAATANGPLSVNIIASTPYTVAVGGTRFNENGGSSFWAAQNSSSLASAVSYIPEVAWGSNGANLDAGGGGRSTWFAKPSWQTGVPGIPTDGVRDVPDVSLSAAPSNDPYLVCLEGSCAASAGASLRFALVGGTSAAAPSFAGAMALVDQKTGGRQGLANPTLYRLAAAENWASCNASNGSRLPASNCIFNDITAGSNAVPGEAGYGTASATYPAGTGFDLATGLGSINVANLANAWAGGATAPTQAATYYGILNRLSGRCLADSAASLADGAPMILWDWQSGWEQEWQLVPVDSTYYKLVNRNSGKVLDDSGGSLANGTQMIQWDAWGGANQEWQLIPIDSQNYRIMNKLSGKVLDASGGGTADGTPIIQWDWWGGLNQQWRLKAAQ